MGRRLCHVDAGLICFDRFNLNSQLHLWRKLRRAKIQTEIGALKFSRGIGAADFALSEQIGHHVEEEEGEMFPKARKTKLDMQELGIAINRRKAEITLDDAR